MRFIRRRRFAKTVEQIGRLGLGLGLGLGLELRSGTGSHLNLTLTSTRAMKQRSTALGRIAKTKEVPLTKG